MVFLEIIKLDFKGGTMASLSIGEHTFVSKVKFPNQEKGKERKSVKAKREEAGSGRRDKKRWTEGRKEEGCTGGGEVKRAQ